MGGGAVEPKAKIWLQCGDDSSTNDRHKHHRTEQAVFPTRAEVFERRKEGKTCLTFL